MTAEPDVGREPSQEDSHDGGPRRRRVREPPPERPKEERRLEADPDRLPGADEETPRAAPAEDRQTDGQGDHEGERGLIPQESSPQLEPLPATGGEEAAGHRVETVSGRQPHPQKPRPRQRVGPWPSRPATNDPAPKPALHHQNHSPRPASTARSALSAKFRTPSRGPRATLIPSPAHPSESEDLFRVGLSDLARRPRRERVHPAEDPRHVADVVGIVGPVEDTILAAHLQAEA